MRPFIFSVHFYGNPPIICTFVVYCIGFMKVLKFGGTSVQNAENITKTIAIIKENLAKEQLVVVVSALGGVTNMLIECCTQTLTEIKNRHFETINNLLSGSYKDDCEQYTNDVLSELKDILTGISLIRELTPRSLDLVSSVGERLSAYIIAKTIAQRPTKRLVRQRSTLRKPTNLFRKKSIILTHCLWQQDSLPAPTTTRQSHSVVAAPIIRLLFLLVP